MIFSREFLEGLSGNTGFMTNNLEKVCYLIKILQSIAEHPFLKSRMALKGGSAINLFYLQLPRLSVDIDLNYIGAVEREVMLDERKQVENALTRILENFKIDVRRVPEEHAGGKWRIRFESIFGGHQTLELDVNYLMRVPFYGIEQKKFFAFDKKLQVKFPIVSFEEAFAGKIVAMLDRATVRDIFDVDQLSQLDKTRDLKKLKVAIILIGSCSRNDWRKISPAKIESVSAREFRQQLSPFLNISVTHDFEQMKKNCIALVQKLLQYDKNEQAFLNEILDKGDYKPELLYPNDEVVVERLKRHPALLWKSIHTKTYKEKQRTGIQ